MVFLECPLFPIIPMQGLEGKRGYKCCLDGGEKLAPPVPNDPKLYPDDESGEGPFWASPSDSAFTSSQGDYGGVRRRMGSGEPLRLTD